MHLIDYSKYSMEELLDVKENIDQELYPEQYANLILEITSRQGQVKPQQVEYNENNEACVTDSKQTDILEFDYFEVEYRCSFKRVITVNLIGLIFGSTFSLMSKEPTSATSIEFNQFLFFEFLILSCLLTSLYTGKSLSSYGVVSIKNSYVYVTISQIINSYLFYLGLFIGIKQFI